MRKNEALEETLNTLKAAGLNPQVSISKHCKVTWEHNGKSYLHVVSRTSSDHRMLMNNRHLLRRTLRDSHL